MSIEDVKGIPAEKPVNRMCYLKTGRDDFESFVADVSRAGKKYKKQVFKRLAFVASTKYSEIRALKDWQKTWTGLNPVHQFRFLNFLRLYNFHYPSSQSRVVLLNWTKKKSDDTNPTVVQRARDLKDVSVELLKGET